MKKMVIVTSQPERDYSLLAMFKALFPDCEIDVVFMGVETLELSQADSCSRPSKTGTIGGRT